MHRFCVRFLLTAFGTVGLLLGAGVDASPSSAAAAGTASPPSNANVFVPTAPMSTHRSGATATLLPDGDVLVAGGGTAAAELYHPKSGTWSATGSMSTSRTDATATLLPDGDVLVAGGCCQPGNPYENLATAELYDPTTGTWSLTGSLNVPRAGATATLLQNGQVLVAGGACNGTNYGCDAGSYLVNLRSAELYNPSTGTWAMTGSMRFGRELQTATLLPSGEVLVAGGFNNCDDDFCTDLANAELYDPVTGTWLRTGSMSGPREQQTATLLPDGDILVAGGLNQGGFSGFTHTYASAELYNPVFGRWTTTGTMDSPRAGQTATLLDGGWVLVAGGGSDTSEVYQPALGQWVSTGDLSTVRTDATATALPDGNVLVAGGTGPDQEPLSTAEVFQSGAGPLVQLSAKALTFATQQVGTTSDALSVTVTNEGTAPLVVQGAQTAGPNPGEFTPATACRTQALGPGASCTLLVRFSPLSPGLRSATVELFDNAPLSPQPIAVSGYGAGPDVWVPTGSMSTPRSGFSSTLLANGQVLVAGGLTEDFGTPVATAELYNPATGAFTPTGSMQTAREFQASALLPDSQVLVAGGYAPQESGGGTLLSSAELYNPATGTWSATGSLGQASDALSATTLANGLVLVTGFGSGSPELYSPTTGTWSDTGPLPTSEGGPVALLPDGQVLLIGDSGTTAALYDPTTNSWSPTAPSGVARFGATATVLADGDVLLVGGNPGTGGYPLSSAELYNSASATWTTTASLPFGRQGQSAVLLSNGAVLLAGGCSDVCENSADTDGTYLYEDGFWSQTASLAQSRYGQSLTALATGDALLVGGAEDDGADATTSAELYISPLVSVAPGQVQPGQAVTISGSGFYAHETVLVSFNGPIYKVLAQPTTNKRGEFQVTVSVPAVHPGTYQVDAQGQTSYASANTELVVTK